MAGKNASSRAMAEHIERMERQKDCKHKFRPVPFTTAHLQCPKCGKRIDND